MNIVCRGSRGLLDAVEQIKRANARDDHDRANKLNG
jgi:hypothetical protein